MYDRNVRQEKRKKILNLSELHLTQIHTGELSASSESCVLVCLCVCLPPWRCLLWVLGAGLWQPERPDRPHGCSGSAPQ